MSLWGTRRDGSIKLWLTYLSLLFTLYTLLSFVSVNTHDTHSELVGENTAQIENPLHGLCSSCLFFLPHPTHSVAFVQQKPPREAMSRLSWNSWPQGSLWMVWIGQETRPCIGPVEADMLKWFLFCFKRIQPRMHRLFIYLCPTQDDCDGVVLIVFELEQIGRYVVAFGCMG